jgi:hypothetical protein
MNPDTGGAHAAAADRAGRRHADGHAQQLGTVGHDELGTINHVAPAVRRRAAGLVRDGVSVTCARPIVTNEIAVDTTIQPLRFMVDSGEGRDTDDNDRILQRRGAAEFIGMVFHGYAITHVDAPSHYFWQGRMYNGRSCNLVTSREGAQAESVDLLRHGVVTRGVLLDVAAVPGATCRRARA